MNRELLSELMRGVDRGLHFLKRVGLEAGQIVVGPRRAVHLDQIHSRGDLLPHRTQDLRHAIRKLSARKRTFLL